MASSMRGRRRWPWWGDSRWRRERVRRARPSRAVCGAAGPNPTIDMTEEAKCKAKYPAPPREQIVEVNPNATLADVLVYVKAGLLASCQAPAPTGPVTLGTCH